MSTEPPAQRLSGWKEIANYFRVSVRTAQSWEAHGLPVRRFYTGDKPTVYAIPADLDRWFGARVVAPGDAPAPNEPALQEQSSEFNDAEFAPPEALFQPAAGPDVEGSRVARRRNLTAFLIIAVVLAGASVTSWRFADRSTAAGDLSKPIGRLFASMSSESGTPETYQIDSTANGIRLSPDASCFFLWQRQAAQVRSYYLATKKLERFEFDSPLEVMEVSKDGKWLLGGTNHGLSMIEIATRRAKAISLGGAVTSIVSAPDNDTVYAAAHTRVVAVSIAKGNWRTLLHDFSPFALALNETANSLYIAYQNGGPGGRDGHDAVEIYDLATGKRTRRPHDLPMVGGPLIHLGIGNRLWADLADGCASKIYDRIGCEKQPAAGYHILDGSTLEHFRTLYLDRHAIAKGLDRGAKVLLHGLQGISLLDSTNLRTLERIPTATSSMDISPDGAVVAAAVPNGVQVFRPGEPVCMGESGMIVHALALDGSLDDGKYASAFQIEGPFQFVPGMAGQALRLKSAKLTFRSPSGVRVGDTQGSLSFWFRSREKSELFARIGMAPFTIEWSDGQIRLRTVASVSPAQTAPAGRWHHFALNFSGDRYEGFLDGISVGSAKAEPFVPRETAPYHASGEFDLDEVMMFNKVLDSADVARLRNLKPDGSCP